MTCSVCEGETVTFAVPAPASDAVSAEVVSLCTQCLAMETGGEPDEDPAFGRVGEDFPTEADAAVPMALLVGLLDSLALHRAEIMALYEEVERAGVDPLLVLDRLARDPDVRTDIDLAGRRRQLEQLL